MAVKAPCAWMNIEQLKSYLNSKPPLISNEMEGVGNYSYYDAVCQDESMHS
jgi:hypothetical protein